MKILVMKIVNIHENREWCVINEVKENCKAKKGHNAGKISELLCNVKY